MRKKASLSLSALAPLLYLAVAVVLVALLATNGVYPSGTDTWFHLYRGNTVYRSIQQGILFPFYDPMWFNGTELLRFSSPLCAYLLALCQALAGGSMFNGYLLFTAILFYLGAIVWLRIGVKAERPILGALLGLAWFFWPYNLRVLFVEGDLPRALAGLFLPWLLYSVISYFYTQNWKWLPAITLGLFFMLLSHVGMAAMTTLCILILMFVCGAVARIGHDFGSALLAVIFAFLLAGLWLVPYLSTGLLMLDQTSAMADSFQTIRTSLDLLGNFRDTASVAYFGVALLVLLLFCGLLARRDSAVLAWSALLLLFMTSTVSYIVLQIFPAAQLLRMLWVFPVSCALGFLAFLLWKTPRRPVLVLLCILLLLDSVPSLSLIINNDQERITADDRMDSALSSTAIKQAQEMTSHRLAILDEGNMSVSGTGLATGWGSPVPIIDGDDRDFAATRTRLLRISRALTGGDMLYVFDRCLELGCDTILLQTGVVPSQDLIDGLVEEAAAQLGYSLALDKGSYRIYHTDLGAGWGLVSNYPAIGIGTTAYYNSFAFPSLQEADSTNLNDYTFEELSRYDLILLSGFTYSDRAAAEELVLALSDAGVHIVIEADGIPESRQSRSRSFLNILCNAVEFSNGYPVLDTIDGQLNTDLFPLGYTQWSTFYVEGLDEVWGTVVDNDVALPFYGTVHNENIVVIGLNLSLHYSLTNDPTVGRLLAHAMSVPDQRLPHRQVVPLGVTYGPSGITVTSFTDRTNTTLAWHDFFRSDRPIRNVGGLLYVDSGETVIQFRYPTFELGLALSLVGLILLCGLTLRGRKYARQAAANRPPEQSDVPPSGEQPLSESGEGAAAAAKETEVTP